MTFRCPKNDFPHFKRVISIPKNDFLYFGRMIPTPKIDFLQFGGEFLDTEIYFDGLGNIVLCFLRLGSSDYFLRPLSI